MPNQRKDGKKPVGTHLEPEEYEKLLDYKTKVGAANLSDAIKMMIQETSEELDYVAESPAEYKIQEPEADDDEEED